MPGQTFISTWKRLRETRYQYHVSRRITGPHFRTFLARTCARTLCMVRTHAAKELPVISSVPLEKQAEVELTTVCKCLEYASVELGV